MKPIWPVQFTLNSYVNRKFVRLAKHSQCEELLVGFQLTRKPRVTSVQSHNVSKGKTENFSHLPQIRLKKFSVKPDDSRIPLRSLIVMSEPYLSKGDSFAFCAAGECTEGGGAVQHSRGCASKRDPVHDGRSISTKTRLQQTYTKTALCHF